MEARKHRQVHGVMSGTQHAGPAGCRMHQGGSVGDQLGPLVEHGVIHDARVYTFFHM